MAFRISGLLLLIMLAAPYRCGCCAQRHRRLGQHVNSQMNVSVVDVGLSDHHLLTWPLPSRKASRSQTI